MYKKIIDLFLALMLMPVFAYAQEVTVTGVGLDHDSALRDAERAAVEQVIGAYVDSRTIVEAAVVEIDEICTKADGYAKVVRIIREGQTANGYEIQAIMDVDTNPSNEFMDKVKMIARLNDPRIAVIILKDGQYNVHEKRIESAVMERLVQLGFSHVVDAGIAAGLHDSQILKSLYNGEPVSNVGSSFGADLVIIGNTQESARQVKIPDFQGGYKHLPLNSGNMEMTIKIIRPSTGNVIDTFFIECKGMGTNQETAEREMVKKTAEEAAQKIEERLRRHSARSSGSVQVIVSSSDYQKISQLVADLKSVPGVQHVALREHNGNRAMIDVSTNQQPGTIVHLLQKHTALEIYVHGMTDSMAQIVLP